MFPDVKFKGKNVILTGHIQKELYDKYNKNLNLIFEILSVGIALKQSKEKTNNKLKTKKGTWELVYTETEDAIVLIHLKLRR